MTRLKVVRPGLLTLVQDLGRWGYERWGVGVGGVLDEAGAFWANWLLGNPPGAAVLEVTAMGPELVVMQTGALAIAGADFRVQIDGQPWENGTAMVVDAGARIRFGRRQLGLRSYLAVPGGIDVPLVLNSRSTDLTAAVGGFGGRPLQPGDEISALSHVWQIRTTQHSTLRYRRILRVLPGVRLERFAQGTFTRLVTSQFQVSADSNAMGVRLQGPALANPGGSWPSEGMAVGAIQCLPSGQPLILLKNRGTIGGYPVIAHVARADWPVLGQVAPGESLAFVAVTPQEARAALRKEQEWLGSDCRPRLAEVPAPFMGIVSGEDIYGRGLPRLGEWVHQGQLIRRIQALGSWTECSAPVDGVLVQALPGGNLVRTGDPLFVIREEVGNGRGDDGGYQL